MQENHDAVLSPAEDTEKKKPGRPPVEKPIVPKMYKITIHSSEGDGDKGDVILVHNYNQIQIQRDKEVTISEKFLECLKRSVIETQIKDEAGNVRAVKVPRYSYSVTPA